MQRIDLYEDDEGLCLATVLQDDGTVLNVDPRRVYVHKVPRYEPGDPQLADEVKFEMAVTGDEDALVAVTIVDRTDGTVLYGNDAADPEPVCLWCGRYLEQNPDGRWIDPDATGDYAVWRETCDSHDTFTAEHEPPQGVRERREATA